VDEEDERLCLFCGRPCKRWWHDRPADHPVKVGEPLTAEVRPEGYYARTGGTGEIVREVRKAKRRRMSPTIEVWTGKFLHYGTSDAPFCRLRCAESYAIEAARQLKKQGWRLVFKHATEKESDR
jgi:hypothetical protein